MIAYLEPELITHPGIIIVPCPIFTFLATIVLFEKKLIHFIFIFFFLIHLLFFLIKLCPIPIKKYVFLSFIFFKSLIFPKTFMFFFLWISILVNTHRLHQ